VLPFCISRGSLLGRIRLRDRIRDLRARSHVLETNRDPRRSLRFARTKIEARITPECESTDFFVISLRGWRDESDWIRLDQRIDAIQQSASDLSRTQDDQTSSIRLAKTDSVPRLRDDLIISHDLILIPANVSILVKRKEVCLPMYRVSSDFLCV